MSGSKKRAMMVQELIAGWVNGWVRDLTNVVAGYFEPRSEPALSDLVLELCEGYNGAGEYDGLRFGSVGDPLGSPPFNRNAAAGVVYHDRPGLRFQAIIGYWVQDYFSSDGGGFYLVEEEQRNNFYQILTMVYSARYRQLGREYSEPTLLEWATNSLTFFPCHEIPDGRKKDGRKTGVCCALLRLDSIYETPSNQPQCTLSIEKIIHNWQ